MKRIATLLLLVCSLQTAQAVTYYVNDNSLAGDLGAPFATAVGLTANNGTTAATPKRLISEVVSSYTLAAGDIIYVQTGNYQDEVTLTNLNGNAVNKISIIGAGCGNTILTTMAGTNRYAFRLNNSDYFVISDIRINITTNTDDGIKVYDDSDNNEFFNLCMYSVEYGFDILTANFTNVAGNSTTAIPENNLIHDCYIQATWVGIRIKAPSQNEAGTSQCNYQTTPCSNFGPQNNRIYDNTIIDIGPTSYACIELQAVGSRNDLYRNTLAINTGVSTTGGGIVLANNVIGVVFTNNYIINLSSTGGNGVYVVPAANRTYSMDFIHNSIYSVESCIDGSAGLKDFTMVNNILYSTNGFCIDYGTLADPKAAANIMKECRNNLYYYPNYASSPTTAGLARYNTNTVVGTVAAWQTYNVDGINSDAYSIGGSAAANNPQYVNPAAYLLDIPNTSPAVDNTYVLGTGDPGIGTNSQVASANFVPVVDDIYNTARPVGIRKDIGAFENLTPLPINLLEFRGHCQDEGVLLTWSTLLEEGNSFFTIEGSKDGRIYENLATIPGAINSSGLLTYSYTVTNTRYSYFRLKQTDVDGKNSRSYPIVTDCYEQKDIIAWQLGNDLYIQVPSELNDNSSRLMVYNELGQELFYHEARYEGNVQLYVVSLEEFSSGIYPARIICGDKMIGIKILRQ